MKLLKPLRFIATPITKPIQFACDAAAGYSLLLTARFIGNGDGLWDHRGEAGK